MLSQLLPLTRPLFILDLETTSLDIDVTRVIEIAFRKYEASGMTKEWSMLINPGMPIPNTEHHPITDTLVVDSPSFSQLAANLAKGFSDCDFAGQNIRYDLKVIAAEMTRAKISWSYANARIIDTFRVEQIGEPRTLSHLYEKHTGKKLEGAHRALEDVKATSELLFEQLRKYQTIPRNLDMLHDAQWPGWIDTEGKFRFTKEGVPTIQFGKHRNDPMRTVPLGYWSFILKGGFSPEIKQIAQNALNGIYPIKVS